MLEKVVYSWFYATNRFYVTQNNCVRISLLRYGQYFDALSFQRPSADSGSESGLKEDVLSYYPQYPSNNNFENISMNSVL